MEPWRDECRWKEGWRDEGRWKEGWRDKDRWKEGLRCEGREHEKQQGSRGKDIAMGLYDQATEQRMGRIYCL
jgi:hypothetical protein